MGTTIARMVFSTTHPRSDRKGREATVVGVVYPAYSVVANDPALREPTFFEETGGAFSLYPPIGATLDPSVPTVDPATMPTLDPVGIPTANPALPLGNQGAAGSANLPWYWEDSLASVYDGGYLPEYLNVYTIIELRDHNDVALTVR